MTSTIEKKDSLELKKIEEYNKTHTKYMLSMNYKSIRNSIATKDAQKNTIKTEDIDIRYSYEKTDTLCQIVINHSINNKYYCPLSKVDRHAKTLFYTALFKPESVKVEIEKAKEQKVYKRDLFESIDDFIIGCHAQIAISILKSMYYKCRKLKNGNCTNHVNYESVKQIVENGFNDNLTDDIKQIVAMALLENKENIEKDDNGFVDLMKNDIYLLCYRAVSNFLYNQKTKCDIKHVSYCGFNDDTQNDISLKNDSIEWRMYVFNEYDYTSKSVDDVIDIIEEIKAYIEKTEKPFIYDKCMLVLACKYSAMTHKQIAKELNISVDSVTKYNNILVSAYNATQKPHNDNKPCYVSRYNIEHKKLATVKKIVGYKPYKKRKITDNNYKLFVPGLQNKRIYNWIVEKYDTINHKEKTQFYNNLFGYRFEPEFSIDNILLIVDDYNHGKRKNDIEHAFNSLESIKEYYHTSKKIKADNIQSQLLDTRWTF